MKAFRLIAIENFPLVQAGNDLPRMLVEVASGNGVQIEDGDVIVIAQKVFSKAENRIVNMMDVKPSERATEIGKKIGKSPRFVELVLQETSRPIKISPGVFLVEDKRGLVCINAGIDKSNVKGDGVFALLPENPDKSASSFRTAIKRITGKNVAIVICDTYSRPFRRGQVNFAIGISGIKPFRDYRQQKDMFGQILKVKNVAVVDEIASAAELLMGQATESRPFVIVRGLEEFIQPCETCTAKELQISNAEDLFRGAL